MESLADRGIPASGLGEAVVEGDRGLPVQFTLQLVTAQSVAPVVPGAIRDRLKQILGLASDF